MVGAAGAAVWLPAAALPGSPWLGVLLGAALVMSGLAVRQWASTVAKVALGMNLGIILGTPIACVPRNSRGLEVPGG